MHPRNRFAGGYDFSRLVRRCPELARFVHANPTGIATIDFADPAAVTLLNRALLLDAYGLAHWDIPVGQLCPPIPGRADYLHHIADLLADGQTAPPRGPAIALLDIGVGASCIYPIIGVAEYDWRFVGTDIDPASLAWARKLIAANPTLSGRIECRFQPLRSNIFRGAVKSDETFAASICNPPFHASAEDAAAGTLRKLKNLNRGKATSPVRNFGGRANELWCEGGEAAFVARMIAESAQRPELCRWFTTLVSKRETLPAIHRALQRVKATEVRVIDLAHGQKKSRIVAWRFAPGPYGRARA
ncbi:MAG TPA: 23S rRNA (adenine(1618)-N(6))-methyltransferase RlmF [Opitutus sp.]|nr:23S rRNA (adenine(1618)-N(6))-methyltransferase RlmF [Opitutus sp.]